MGNIHSDETECTTNLIVPSVHVVQTGRAKLAVHDRALVLKLPRDNLLKYTEEEEEPFCGQLSKANS
jgi:hypothetical protein